MDVIMGIVGYILAFAPFFAFFVVLPAYLGWQASHRFWR